MCKLMKRGNPNLYVHTKGHINEELYKAKQAIF